MQLVDLFKAKNAQFFHWSMYDDKGQFLVQKKQHPTHRTERPRAANIRRTFPSYSHRRPFLQGLHAAIETTSVPSRRSDIFHQQPSVRAVSHANYRPLVTGSQSATSTSLTAKVAAPSWRRSDVMAMTATALSACAATAWSFRCYNKRTPRYRVNSFGRATGGVFFGLVTGSLVAVASTALMPTALALGPCLGVTFLTVPIMGVAQVGLGVVYSENATPRGGGHLWLTGAIFK
nr:hypothetical protein [Pandoravirus massiliensis]